jgi:hypothetical protein
MIGQKTKDTGDYHLRRHIIPYPTACCPVESMTDGIMNTGVVLAHAARPRRQ